MRLRSLARRARNLARPGMVRRLARALRWYALGGRFVFVLGHMRSGSSLLAHILQTHPDITGIGETHRRYLGVGDLVLLAGEVADRRGLARLPPRVLEKALDLGQVAGDVLSSPRVQSVILVREPRATLNSFIADQTWLIGRAHVPLEVRVGRAARWLATSYAELAEHARALGSRAFALDYDDLVARPDATLAALTRWLALSPPLTPRYRVDALTHERGRGDPTEAILRGVIDPAIPRATFALDPTWVELVERRYVELRRVLARCAGPEP